MKAKKAGGGSSYGKDDNSAHRTRARDPVLHRNRRQPCRCWHHRARNAVYGHQGIPRPRSRERGLCAYGQRTRCAPCDPRGCGADIDRAARREQRYEPTREARWRRSHEAGRGNERRGASRAGNSATVASPGPAPKTIIALSSGWLAIRPRWIVHRCYSGPWRPRRGAPPRSRSPARAFRDVAPGPVGRPRLDSERFRSTPRTCGRFRGNLSLRQRYMVGSGRGAHARFRTTPVHHPTERRGRCLAAGDARAESPPRDRVFTRRASGAIVADDCLPAGFDRGRRQRRQQPQDRESLGRRPIRSATGIGGGFDRASGRDHRRSLPRGCASSKGYNSDSPCCFHNG
jgi:hypothetical protein